MIDEKIERIARFKEGNKEFLLTGEVGGEWVAAIGNKSQYVAIGEIVTYGDDSVEFMASGPSPSAALSALLVAITGGSTKDDPITTVNKLVLGDMPKYGNCTANDMLAAVSDAIFGDRDFFALAEHRQR